MVKKMEPAGISVVQTSTGLQLTLEGEMYQQIAKQWEEGQLKPFYSILKEFIKSLKEAYEE